MDTGSDISDVQAGKNLQKKSYHVTNENLPSQLFSRTTPSKSLLQRPSVLAAGSLHHTPPTESVPKPIESLTREGSYGTGTDTITQSVPEETVEPFIIGVTGASASGKTTVCEKIIDGLGDHRCVLLSMDWFYHGLLGDADASNYNFDHPSAFDFPAICDTLLRMKQREPVSVPKYNFASHEHDPNNAVELNVADVIIVEGILTFYDPSLRNMMHMKVFVDEDADVCLSRRIKRDVACRGRSLETILERYNQFVKPSFEEFILPTKRHADIIMPRGAENVVLIDMVIKHIALKIRQDDLRKLYPGLVIMSDSFQTRGLHTIIRDRHAGRDDIVFYSNRLMRLLVEEGLGLLPFRRRTVTTCSGGTYYGVGFVAGLAAISLLPDGGTMESSLRAVCNTVRIGKMMVSRDGKYVEYQDIPAGLGDRFILILAPVLNSGKACETAIARLVDSEVGCQEDRIFVLSMVVAPEAVRRICSRFPNAKLIVSAVDKGMDENGLAYPGIGQFATRYFGTE